MTNKEILQADMLDILFEHRNKLYGAYALRKTYSQRLGRSLGIALTVVLAFITFSFLKKEKNNDRYRSEANAMILTDVNLEEKIKEPEKPKDLPPPQKSQAAFNDQIIIAPNEEVTESLPTQDQISTSVIGNENIDGVPDDGKGKQTAESNGTGTEIVKEPEQPIKEIIPNRNPSFPGGTAAWLAFLQKYLQAPEDLEPGQRIEVQVRFWVDVDGSVSRAEVVKSGGSIFDKEVLRVMKRMPKWEPAIQGGNYIAVPYTQPVIFVGVDE
jgi:protein TonB